MTTANWIGVICAVVCAASLSAHLLIYTKLNRLYRLWNQTIMDDWKRRGVDVPSDSSKGAK